MKERGNAVVAVLIVAVIALAAFVAYNQGYLGGKDAESGTDVNINLPGGDSY